jgi:hypothetical protein
MLMAKNVTAMMLWRVIKESKAWLRRYDFPIIILFSRLRKRKIVTQQKRRKRSRKRKSASMEFKPASSGGW